MEQDSLSKIDHLQHSKKDIGKRQGGYLLMAFGSVLALALTTRAGNFIMETEGSMSNLEILAELTPFLPLIFAGRRLMQADNTLHQLDMQIAKRTKLLEQPERFSRLRQRVHRPRKFTSHVS